MEQWARIYEMGREVAPSSAGGPAGENETALGRPAKLDGAEAAQVFRRIGSSQGAGLQRRLGDCSHIQRVVGKPLCIDADPRSQSDALETWNSATI